jgi:hypothetical protein
MKQHLFIFYQRHFIGKSNATRYCCWLNKVHSYWKNSNSHNNQLYSIQSNFWKFHIRWTGFFGGSVYTVWIGMDFLGLRTVDTVCMRVAGQCEIAFCGWKLLRGCEIALHGWNVLLMDEPE